MKFRFFNKLWAKAFGLFWTDCPLCGQYFGGHEWKGGSIPESEKEWSHNDRVSIQMGTAICPDCESSKEHADVVNKPGQFRADVVTDYLERHCDTKS